MNKLLISICLLLSTASFSQVKKISQLPAATSIGASDLIPIVQSGITKKVTHDVVAKDILNEYVLPDTVSRLATKTDVRKNRNTISWSFYQDSISGEPYTQVLYSNFPDSIEFTVAKAQFLEGVFQITATDSLFFAGNFFFFEAIKHIEIDRYDNADIVYGVDQEDIIYFITRDQDGVSSKAVFNDPIAQTLLTLYVYY